MGAGAVALAMATLASGCGSDGSPSGTATSVGGVKLVEAGIKPDRAKVIDFSEVAPYRWVANIYIEFFRGTCSPT